jgi:hypothetical protein
MVMVELSEFQIDIVSAYIRENGVAQDELHEDLLDHVCTSIENRLRQGDSFEDAFHYTIKLFGPGGLMQVQQDTFELLTEINTIMKKLAFGFGLTSTFLLLAGTIFKLMHWPGANIMVVIGAGLLVLFYLPLLLYYKLKESPRSEALMHTTGFIGLAFTTLGTLFKIMHWPGAAAILLGGMAALAFGYVPLYFYKKYQSSVNKPITLSASLVAITCLILVFALTRINPSIHYERGISMIDEQLRESAASGSNNAGLYAKLSGNANAQLVKQSADETYQYLENLKLAIITDAEGISMNEARTISLQAIKNKDNFDVPTHLLFGSNVDSPFYHGKLVEHLGRFERVLLNSYPLAVQADMKSLLPFDTSRMYEKDGEKQDWVRHNFEQMPVIGVVSLLSKLQSDIRQSENIALVYLLSQPEASNPPS